MEKNNMYPPMPNLQGAQDAPPSYAQAFNPAHPASAPSPEFVPMAQPGSLPPQPAAYPQPHATFIQTSGIPPLGPQPCVVTCPSCHQQRVSAVRYETSTKTHLFAAIICLLGLCCCACIPYCVDSCKSTNHYCSNCDAYLGAYNK